LGSGGYVYRRKKSNLRKFLPRQLAGVALREYDARAHSVAASETSIFSPVIMPNNSGKEIEAILIRAKHSGNDSSLLNNAQDLRRYPRNRQEGIVVKIYAWPFDKSG
jgi:hypothetical protein